MAIGIMPGQFGSSAERTRITLGELTPGAQRFNNVPGVATPIIAWEVPARAEWELVAGTVPNLRLYRNDGQQISRRSRIVIASRLPHQEIPREVLTFSYDPFYSLTVDQQNDDAYKARLQLLVPGGGVSFGESYRLELWLASPDQVDWDYPDTFVALDVYELRLL